jgi:hypothetical protein
VDPNPLKQRAKNRASFLALVFRFYLENHPAVAFIAGWSAYPIGAGLLALLGTK